MKLPLFTVVALTASFSQMVASAPTDASYNSLELKEISDIRTLETTHSAILGSRNAEANPAAESLRQFWEALANKIRAKTSNPVTQNVIADAIYDIFKDGVIGLVNIFSTNKEQGQEQAAFGINPDGDGTPYGTLKAHVNGLAALLPGDIKCALIEKGATTGYDGSLLWAPIHIVSGYSVTDFDQFCTKSGDIAVLLSSPTTGNSPLIALSDGMKLSTDTDNYRLVISY